MISFLSFQTFAVSEILTVLIDIVFSLYALTLFCNSEIDFFLAMYTPFVFHDVMKT